MEIGRIGILAGLGTSTLATLLYLAALRGNRKTLQAARAVYALAATCIIFSFGRLMWLVVHHQFQFQYVFDYSSEDLGPPFLYAATWAGQEGSFLLWTFWTAVIGGLVAWKAGRWEARVMPIYVSTLIFLFAILTWLDPYHLIPRGTGPNDYPLDLPWPPQFGKGLNPSLQNYWMAIHPPTIFFGFASLAVPFAYAIAAMIWKEYETWAPRVMPWVLMTVATLGIGLFMGGYWAYETQGWHGFWAWDPVENASLFPWLGALALLHGLVVQKSRGGMGRTNLFLAISAWSLFLYGTFLTRSGVLANFSVHSFVSLASTALMLLLVMIGVYMAGGLFLLALRWRSIPGRPISDKMLSRDTAMVLAVTLMIVGCLIVGIGTSWPLISRLPLLKSLPVLSRFYAEKGMAVQPVFYNRVGVILVIPGLIFMGIVPFLAWGKTNVEKFLWKVLAPWFAAIGGGFLLVWFVLHEASSGWNPETMALGYNPDTPRGVVVAIGTLGLFAAFANIALAAKLLRIKAVTMGGWLSHVGIGLLLLGTVVTNVYEKTQNTVLIEGSDPIKTPFGYSLQFAGWTHDGKTPEEIQKDWWKFEHAVKIRVTRNESGSGVAHADDTGTETASDNGKGFLALAPVFHNKQLMLNQEDEGPTTMRWPYIHKEFQRDFYIGIASDPKLLRPSATLQPGETATIGYPNAKPTGYMVHYKKFYMNGKPGQAGTVMGAEMELTTPDGRKVPIKPGMSLGGGPNGPERANVDIPAINGAVLLQGGVDAASKQVTVVFEFPDAPAVWAVPVSITNKPGINLVWLGVILMGVGTLCAMLRRSVEARKNTVFQMAAAAGVVDVPLEVPAAVVRDDGNGHVANLNGHAKARPRRAARAKR